MKKVNKIIPYFFTLLILAGLFGPMAEVNAQESLFTDYAEQGGVESVRTREQAVVNNPNSTQAQIDAANAKIDALNARFAPPAPSTSGTDFEKELGSCSIWYASTWGMCIAKVFYWTYFLLPSFLLYVAALFFNAMVNIALMSDITINSTFIPAAWAVVRDFSNIFFILILLYVAIQTILGLSHEAKRVIIWVVIMALLINFSMFFTKVVIDSSNILALVFYNKLGEGTQASEKPTGSGEKDITGTLITSFNPTKLVDDKMFKNFQKIPIGASIKTTDEESTPASLMIGMIVVSGSIMLFAAYAFFVSGFAFLGRLIELWILIIFSPFAFMSYALPKLAGREYLGWNDWFKRLIATSFMAPIFMFFLYLIFILTKKLADPNIFVQGGGPMATILGILIPLLIILALLLKATHFAKKGGGQFGEMLLKGGAMLGGLAIGAATGGAAMALTAGVGGLASKAGSSKLLQENAKKTGWRGVASRMALRTADYGSKASFDMRKAPGVGTLAKAGGLDLGKAKEGGYERMRTDKIKKRQERAKQLEVRENETLKQNLNKTEEDLQKLLNENSKELNELDMLITKKKEELRDTAARFGGGSNQAKQAGLDLQNIKDRKKALKDGSLYLGDKDLAGNVTGANAKNYTNVNAGTYEDSNGIIRNRSINYIEDIELRDRKHEIETENRARKRAYANRVEGKGSKIMFWRKTRANKEVAHKIRMETKLDSGEKGGH